MKWIILFFVVCISVQDICQNSDPENLSQNTTNLPEVINNRNDNMLHSLICLLHFNAGDLTENASHTTWEKKGLLRLFTHPASYLYSPVYSGNLFQSCNFHFTGRKQTDYYIYALHKIII